MRRWSVRIRLWAPNLGVYMSDGGKGSKPRPFSVDTETFDNNFDRIFGKKVNRVIVDEVEELITRNNEETQEVLKQK